MPRTSRSHPLHIATLATGAGRIGITLCPGKQQRDGLSGHWQRDLDTDLQAIRDWGASQLVTLIEAHEFRELQVEALPLRAKESGLHWRHLPIRDGNAPDARFDAQWRDALPALLAVLSEGGGIVVHCKGGLGRAGTVAAMLLMASDDRLSPAQAIARVRAVRPGAIETREQECYLLQWRSAWRLDGIRPPTIL